MIKPIPYPKHGLVQKLKMKIAPEQAEVYIEQTQWPRQRQNPNWRIEVTNIDGRYDEYTRKLLKTACEDTARIYLAKWLATEAPLLTIETVTWEELVQLATRPRFNVLSNYQRRRQRPKPRIKSQITPKSKRKEKVEEQD